MSSLISKRPMPLTQLVEEPVYYCHSVTTRFKYDDGKRTDTISGYVYTATNTETFEQIQVVIEQKKPLMSPEKLMQLQDEGEKVFVEFINAAVRPYYSERTKSIEDSIKADDVKLVELN